MTNDEPSSDDSNQDVRWVMETLWKIFGHDRHGHLGMWLDSPHPDLGGLSPARLICDGRARVIREMLEDVINGEMRG